MAALAGRPLVQHVYERASRCGLFSRLVVATDDGRIRDAVEAFGGQAVMTSPDHRSGTDRVAEVAATSDAEVVVNIQGDEPFVNERVLQQVVEPLAAPDPPAMATLCKRIDDPAALDDPNVVKVVRRLDGSALYFSRSPIPYRGAGRGVAAWEHIGIYAFRREFLLAFPRLPRTALERAERLEQLRALEHGRRIAVVPTVHHVGVSVDTPADLRRAERLLREAGKGGPLAAFAG